MLVCLPVSSHSVTPRHSSLWRYGPTWLFMMSATRRSRVHGHAVIRRTFHPRLTDRSPMTVNRVALLRRPGSATPPVIPLDPHWHALRMCSMRASVLLHVVLACKRLIANRTVHALLARMLFAMSGRMPRGGKCRRTAVACGKRAGVLVFSGDAFRCHGFLRSAD